MLFAMRRDQRDEGRRGGDVDASELERKRPDEILKAGDADTDVDETAVAAHPTPAEQARHGFDEQDLDEVGLLWRQFGAKELPEFRQASRRADDQPAEFGERVVIAAVVLQPNLIARCSLSAVIDATVP